MTVFKPNHGEGPEPAVVAWLAARGLPTSAIQLLPDVGFVNWVFRVGDDLILRVAKNAEGEEDARTESVAVPIAVAAGLPTPRLLEFDASCSVLPTVATLYERAAGVTLGREHVDQAELAALYRELGAEIGRLHATVKACPDPNEWLDKPELFDARAELRRARVAKKVEQVTYDWLSRWLDRLEPALETSSPRVFLHNDLHSFNVMVHRRPLRLSAVLDWGDAGWGDPCLEFETMPIWAVDWALETYEAELGEIDPAFCGRLLWHNLGAALDTTTEPWEETDEPWQPLTTSRWINLIRFFSGPLHPRWLPWIPPGF